MFHYLIFIRLFMAMTVWTSVRDPTPSNKAHWNCIGPIIRHFIALNHPPHSKHLAPCDFCPVPKLKNTRDSIITWMITMMPREQWSSVSVNTMHSSIMTASWKYLNIDESVFNTEVINLLMPNVNYSGRTTPLTSKVAFYIFIQQI